MLNLVHKFYCSGKNIRTGYMFSDTILAKSYSEARKEFQSKYPYSEGISIVGTYSKQRDSDYKEDYSVWSDPNTKHFYDNIQD